ncbi:VOC family protein [Akkermansiaceae bacterium]|nr:VOC family protein [Akkermansiaceae bacterium]MDA9831682.1 VOC family protein [Akkermansiaceae bacterium]MDB4370391.1 VOC family protein [Akkermansiaceae bacterium]MDB4461819.1 VOC family protein [bacterium]MDB4465374.1 VOC family protein [Akkermansiaceae bacterium]
MTTDVKWTLWRQDDYGSCAIIERHLKKSVADSRLRELEERGHKQHYWIERENFDGSPRMNLVVIRSQDVEASKSFYEKIGLTFERHMHGKGAEHYASESSAFVFEIYPDSGTPSSGARVGFSVSDVDSTIEALRETGIEIVAEPKDSPWGRRAVVRDPDGHSVELTATIEAEQGAGDQLPTRREANA